MRTLPEELETRLKSRSMVGDGGRPSYSVSIQGLSSGNYEWQSSYTAYNPHTSNADYHPSCIRLDDGRVLYMYSRGTDPGVVYQAFVDPDEFITENDSVASETAVLSNLYYPRATLFRGLDNGLYFAVAYTKTNSENVAKVLIYKSALGDASDWSIYATVDSVSWGGNNIFAPAERLPVGLPIIYDNKLILPHVDFSEVSGYLVARLAISSSTDGVNWTSKATFSSGGNGINTEFGSRNFGQLGSDIWWSWFGSYSYGFVDIIKSSDGETWENPFDGNINVPSVTMLSDSNLYAIIGDQNQPFSLYKAESSPTQYSDFVVQNVSLPVGDSTHFDPNIIACDIGDRLIVMSGSLTDGRGVSVVGIEKALNTIPVKSISISRNKNMAASLELVIDNSNGDWAPDGTLHKEILWPNKVVTTEQGYGSALISTFKGLIDSVEMSSFPQETRCLCRDYLKYALDQIVTKAVEGGNTHVLNYQAQTVEYIVTDLASLCGLTLLEEIYTTGITIADITFSWESYADAFQQLADLCGSDFGCDENGKFYFRKDYIPDTPTIAYAFKEGEDIISLGYTLSDADIYQKVVCYGQKSDGSTVFAQTNYTSRVYYNVLANKYMKIDAGSSAQTVEAAQALTDRAEMLMRSRVRICQFQAVAVPHLQVGDVIQVIESSTTISEAYRITDLSTVMDPLGYTMQITCYHHSYAE